MSVDEANAGSGSGTTDHRKRDLSSHDLMERQSQQEPLEPVVASDDKSFIGYILTGNEELQRTAVIVLHKFTTVNQTQVQSLLSQFLGVCREQGADHLILDITSNGGGSIIVSYDIMKQVKLAYHDSQTLLTWPLAIPWALPIFHAKYSCAASA